MTALACPAPDWRNPFDGVRHPAEAWLAATAREIHEAHGTWPSAHELANAASHGMGYRPPLGVLNRVLFTLAGDAGAGATLPMARGGKAGVRR